MENELKSMEAEIAARRREVKPTYQHYGSEENLSANETRVLEAEIATRRREVKPTYQHYSSVENLSASETRILEAQVSEKRKQDVPYKEYLNGLISNPYISDVQQFEDAVIRSMQSNGLIRDFTSALVWEISKAAVEFEHIGKTDIYDIQNQKQRIEDLTNIYVRYLYELKRQGWAFYGLNNDIGLEMITRDVLDTLWQVQKQFDFTFQMPIPQNLGAYYGQAFERRGKMVPAITLMYDDLKNREVNWHQVLIYKENELTPRQRYMQRKETNTGNKSMEKFSDAEFSFCHYEDELQIDNGSQKLSLDEKMETAKRKNSVKINKNMQKRDCGRDFHE